MQNSSDPTVKAPPTHVVGIGASAGGLEALEKLFRATPTDTGMAFVVIQHLSPDFKSLMDELLARFTSMPVRVINETLKIESNTIYILPPKKNAIIEGYELIAYEKSNSKQLSLPINVFFNSLAASWGERAVAIVLSGTGSDGSEGILSIQEAGGYVIAQEPNTAKFDGMPQSAIATGRVDKVCAPEHMLEVLQRILSDSTLTENLNPELDEIYESGDYSNSEIKKILNILKDKFFIDFNSYKPSTVLRRIYRRISLQGRSTNIDDYANTLAESPTEIDALYRDLLIGVTGFFRDPDAFDALLETTIKPDLDELSDDQDYRIWVCGCSTGEEAYTVAMLVLNEFELRGQPPTVKVFATDVNHECLEVAAEGVYSYQEIINVPANLREKYFIPQGAGTYKVSTALRKVIIFSEHNLLKNPPFTRMHVVLCRNLLIYLKNSAQSPAITSFNFSLVNRGTLFLGVSETLGNLADDFEIIDRTWKIFRKTRESTAPLMSRPPENAAQLLSYDFNRDKRETRYPLARIYYALLDRYIDAAMLLGSRRELIHLFGKANKYFINSNVKLLNDVVPALDPAISQQTLALLDQLSNNNQTRQVQTDPIQLNDSEVEITAESFVDKITAKRYFLVYFNQKVNKRGVVEKKPPVLASKEFSLPDDVQDLIQQLQGELRRTQEALQTNAEELETSNEELQASNEELQSSNEELQSTNEELHSVNEELYTVNTELESKVIQLDRTSTDLRNLVEATQISTVFLDNQFKIRLFTSRSKEIFNLVNNDIGRDIRIFTPKIEDHFFERDIQDTYVNKRANEKTVRAKDGSGKVYLRKSNPHFDSQGKLEGVILTYTEISGLAKRGVMAWIKEAFRKSAEPTNPGE